VDSCFDDTHAFNHLCITVVLQRRPIAAHILQVVAHVAKEVARPLWNTQEPHKKANIHKPKLLFAVERPAAAFALLPAQGSLWAQISFRGHRSFSWTGDGPWDFALSLVCLVSANWGGLPQRNNRT
jgi:hypothetical protein